MCQGKTVSEIVGCICDPLPNLERPLPLATHLDGCEVLKVTVWVGDQAQGAVPLGGRVNPNLIVLVSSQEPGSIWAKTG